MGEPSTTVCDKDVIARLPAFVLTVVSALFVASDHNVLEHSLGDLCGWLLTLNSR